jgi:dihydrofolate reductase
MRKVYFHMMLSADGYFEGKDHDISWHNVDAELNKFEIEQLRETDLFLFGRRIYELMEDSWPAMSRDPKVSGDDAEIARLINNTHKIVFSRTLDKVEEKENWRNVRLVHELDPEEIRRLKNQPGKSISVGGSDLALSFIRSGLIDEFRFTITPAAIGQGTKIFEGLGSRLNLELKKTRRFESGNMLLYYIPANAPGLPSKRHV